MVCIIQTSLFYIVTMFMMPIVLSFNATVTSYVQIKVMKINSCRKFMQAVNGN